VARLQAVDVLVQLILSKWQYYEDDTIHIFPKRQGELWHEGYDEEEEKYVGSKWGKYLRAPDIFFRVLEKGEGKLVPLKQVASVRRGFTTGAVQFFYLTEGEIRHWGIEREFWMHAVSKEEQEQLQQTPFWDTLKEALWQDESGQAWLPNYVVKSPQECESILVDPARLRHRVLLIHKPREALTGHGFWPTLRRVSDGVITSVPLVPSASGFTTTGSKPSLRSVCQNPRIGDGMI
jgi:hypothetical protein